MKLQNLLLISIIFLFSCQKNQSEKENSDMDSFISDLMNEMTVEEKIWQLNLITPGGGIPTGSVVSTDVESKIKERSVYHSP